MGICCYSWYLDYTLEAIFFMAMPCKISTLVISVLTLTSLLFLYVAYAIYHRPLGCWYRIAFWSISRLHWSLRYIFYVLLKLVECGSGFGDGVLNRTGLALQTCSTLFQANLNQPVLTLRIKPRLNYTWEPQISIPVTGALVFYPIGQWHPAHACSSYLTRL